MVYNAHDGRRSASRTRYFVSMLHWHIHRTYVPDGIYFVTTDVRYRIPIFADTEIARIVGRSIWHERASRFVVYAYVIMPDHLHMLLRPTKENISEIMRSIKTNSSREINRSLQHSRGHATSAMEMFAWQQSFYDHVITDDDDFRNHVEYIQYNPVRVGLCKTPEEYRFLFIDDKAMSKILSL